jgi:hypothetical protein
MRTHRVWCLLGAATLLAGPLPTLFAQAKDAAARRAPPAVKVTVDTSEVPELADWGARAKALVVTWHPTIARLLHSDGFTPPAEVALVFKKDKKGVAGTAGTTIFIAADWVKRHPEDYGMVIHELTHVIQAYPRFDCPWLVEGIADYIRYYHYEPKTKLPSIDPAKASYRDGYKTTAQFLAWVEGKYDKNLVRELNVALRHGRYQPDVFKDRTGRSLDQLWAEFIASVKRK